MTYYQEHKEACDRRSKRYRDKNRDKIYAKQREWYKSERGQAWTKMYTKRKYLERKGWKDSYLLRHPCVDCGNDDVRVLDFDHSNGDKKFTIPTGLTCSWDKLMKEVTKCEVRCANCHRIRHVNDKAQKAWRKRNPTLVYGPVPSR